MKVAGIMPSYVPEDFNAVREDVVEKTRQAEARNLAAKKAAEFIEHLGSTNDFSLTASHFGKTVEHSGHFTREGVIPGIGQAREFARVSFGLSETRPFAAAELPDGAAVISFLGRKPVEQEKFEEEKERFRQYVELDNRQRLLSDWFTLIQEETGARFFMGSNL